MNIHAETFINRIAASKGIENYSKVKTDIANITYTDINIWSKNKDLLNGLKKSAPNDLEVTYVDSGWYTLIGHIIH